MTKESFNRNPALGVNFIMEIPLSPQFNYFIQRANVPGLAMNPFDTNYRNSQMVIPSNRIEFSPLNVTFLVDEDWENWIYLMDWFKQIRTGKEEISHVMKDISIRLVNSNKSKGKIIKFQGAFPTMVSDLDLESTTVESIPLSASATFRYQQYEIIKEK